MLFHARPEISPARRDFYARLDRQGMAPLWEVLGSLVTTEPKTSCLPAIWRYDDIKPLLLESGALLSVQEAERRVMVLENPGLRGQSRITQSLFTGLQLVMPGEIAPSHRHVASALRFVVESNGAYTAVDGERTTMHPGDFILTPSWTFHDHGNPGDEPATWIDGLDMHIVNMFDTSFAEHYPEEVQPVSKAEGDATARFGSLLLPLEHTASRLSAPVFTYPYARTRDALDRLHRHGPLDPRHGVKLQFSNPVTGGYPMPTIAAFMQILPAGFRGLGYRGTDGTVYSVVEGRGRTRIGDTTFSWGPRDIFVVPSWHRVSHETDEEAVLFSFSDRAAQKALGLWREAEG